MADDNESITVTAGQTHWLFEVRKADRALQRHSFTFSVARILRKGALRRRKCVEAGWL